MDVGDGALGVGGRGIEAGVLDEFKRVHAGGSAQAVFSPNTNGSSVGPANGEGGPPGRGLLVANGDVGAGQGEVHGATSQVVALGKGDGDGIEVDDAAANAAVGGRGDGGNGAFAVVVFAFMVVVVIRLLELVLLLILAIE